MNLDQAVGADLAGIFRAFIADTANDDALDLEALDPATLRLVLHSWPEPEDSDRQCTRCASVYDGGKNVHLVIGETSPPTDTAVCGPCVETIGGYGLAMVKVRNALEDIDYAMAIAPAERRWTIAALITKATGMVSDAYHRAEIDELVEPASGLGSVVQLGRGFRGAETPGADAH